MPNIKLSYYLLSVFVLIPFICYSQSDTPKTLEGVINSHGVFFNQYNKRDQQFQRRLKNIVHKKKVDTILILLNRNMDVIDNKYTLQRDNREYMIYRERGLIYVDYFYYIHLDDGFAEKFKDSLKNQFDEGEKIFDYFINNKIDTIKSSFNFDKNHTVSDEMSEYDGYINIGNMFYHIGDIPKFRVAEIKEDKRLLFYQFVMECLRKAGY